MFHPSFRTLSTREQSRYMRATPEQRARIIRDHNVQCQAAIQRLLDSALEEIDYHRHCGHNAPGTYRNASGYEFQVGLDGQRSEVSSTPPNPDLVWLWEPRRIAWAVSSLYRYHRGFWQPALPAAPFPIPAGQQQPRQQAATGFEGWGMASLGEQAPVTPQVLPCGSQQWQLQQPPTAAPFVDGGEQVNVAAVPQYASPPRPHTAVAAGPQQPPSSPVAAQQQPPLSPAAVQPENEDVIFHSLLSRFIVEFDAEGAIAPSPGHGASTSL